MTINSDNIMISGLFRKLSCLIFVFFAALSTSNAFFENARWYGGLYAPYYSFGGDFDGKKLLTDGVEHFYVPKVKSAAGLGLAGGVRFPRANTDVALEGTFGWCKTTGEWYGSVSDAYFTELTAALKNFFMSRSRLQPYLGVGFGISWLTYVEGVSMKGELGSALYSAVTFNLYGGAAYYLSKNTNIDIGITYKNGGFFSAKGLDSEAKSISVPLDPDMIFPALKVNYLFQ